MIDKENTTNLMHELMSFSELRAYLDKYDFEDSSYLSFTEFIEYLFIKKNIKKSKLVRQINMTRSYAYEIFSGNKRPSREKTLLLSFGLKCDYKETQRLLLSAKHNPLHPKDKRDSIIIFALSNRHSLLETNLLLDEFNVCLLD